MSIAKKPGIFHRPINAGQTVDPLVVIVVCSISPTPHVELHRCPAQRLLFSLYHQACLLAEPVVQAR